MHVVLLWRARTSFNEDRNEKTPWAEAVLLAEGVVRAVWCRRKDLNLHAL